MNPSSERARFEAWKKRDNPRYQPTDDSVQDRRDKRQPWPDREES